MKKTTLPLCLLLSSFTAFAAHAEVCFHADANGAGPQFCMTAGEQAPNAPAFDNGTSSNDQVTSIEFRGPNAKLLVATICQNANFQDCRDFRWNTPGVDGLGQVGLNDWASSFAVRLDSKVCFYNNADFDESGGFFCLAPGEARDGGNFNDSISSFQIFGDAKVHVCVNANNQGPCFDFVHSQPRLGHIPNRPDVPNGDLNDKLSFFEVRP